MTRIRFPDKDNYNKGLEILLFHKDGLTGFVDPNTKEHYHIVTEDQIEDLVFAQIKFEYV